MKRLKLLACKVLYREVSLLTSHCENFVDVTYLQQGLHRTPDILREKLQEEINRIEAGTDIYSCHVYSSNSRENKEFDAILLGYGLCSNAICGLSSKKYKLVVPRAHDCITLFVGSKGKYREYFDGHSGGVYWYTPGWVECCQMPGKETLDIKRKRYMDQYGDEDTADYLLEEEHTWMKQYKMFTYVDWEELHMPKHIQYTKECAEFLHVGFDVLKGSSSLLKDFIDGNWREEDFLILEPGRKVCQSFDETTIVKGN